MFSPEQLSMQRINESAHEESKHGSQIDLPKICDENVSHSSNDNLPKIFATVELEESKKSDQYIQSLVISQ